MKTFKQYIIPFASLRIGKHDFKYEINDEFFSNFEYSLLKSGVLDLDLELDKQQDTMFTLKFNIKGYVNLICERCLDSYQFPLTVTEKLIVKLGEEEYDDPEILVISKNEHTIDVSPLVYEFLCLALPLIHQHKEDETGEPVCNNDTARVLKQLQNPAEATDETAADPRWDILNKLKNN